MHFTFPPEGFAAAVLTDISPSWFLTQAVSNYFLNNKQSACKPPLLAVDVCRAGREEGMVHVTITQSNHFFIKIRRTTCPGLPILWFSAPKTAQLLHSPCLQHSCPLSQSKSGRTGIYWETGGAGERQLRSSPAISAIF